MANIKVENTHFMNFKDRVTGVPTGRNFAGDPSKSRFKAKDRWCYIEIPEEVGLYLERENCWVGKLEPKTGEEQGNKSTYYTQIFINFDSAYPPSINLFCDGNITALDENSIAVLDKINVKSVDCTISPWTNPNTGKTKAYCNVMWVMQDTAAGDPFKNKYQNMANGYGG